MTEFRVWRSIVDWVEDQGGIVYAACPPGSSVFDYNKFCLIDPESSKRDEPDILFSLNGVLYFVECKPTLSGCMSSTKKPSSGESDIDKLRRIRAIYNNGNYDQQLQENFGLDVSGFEMQIAIGYACAPRQQSFPLCDIIGLEVNSDYSIKVVRI